MSKETFRRMLRVVAEQAIKEKLTPHEAGEWLERESYLLGLEKCGDNRSKAARKLGVPRNTLIDALKRLGAWKPRSEWLTKDKEAA